jgi:uncharacterized membrane protein YjjB (DUF3815 family)
MLTGLADFVFVRLSGRVPALRDVWWAVFLAPVAAGFLASLWSRRKKMGRRIVAGLTAGALIGLAYGLVNAFLTPLVPGVLAAAEPAVSGGTMALGILWKTFIFALLAIPGALVAETREPRA